MLPLFLFSFIFENEEKEDIIQSSVLLGILVKEKEKKESWSFLVVFLQFLRVDLRDAD